MNISGMGGMDTSKMMQMMNRMKEQMFSKADADQSGGLSIEEFGQAGPASQAKKSSDEIGKMFAKLDADQDGQLTKAEMEQAKPPNNGLSDTTMSALFEMMGQSSGKEKGASGVAAGDDMTSYLLDMMSQSQKQMNQAYGRGGASSSSSRQTVMA